MSTFLVFLRVLLALGVVLGLVWGLSRLSRRAQGTGRSSRPGRRNVPGAELNVTVVTRRSLSRSSAIAVVRVGERNLVIGTTPQQVTLLTELAPQEWDLDDDEIGEVTVSNDRPWKATSRQSPQAWDAVISTLRERTTRH